MAGGGVAGGRGVPEDGMRGRGVLADGRAYGAFRQAGHRGFVWPRVRHADAPAVEGCMRLRVGHREDDARSSAAAYGLCPRNTVE